VCGIHLQCARLVECGCRFAGVEWLRCALRWLERCGRRCGERQSRARSMAKQCNILYIENIENNDSNAAASSLLGWATVNAWSVEQTIRRGETSQHHNLWGIDPSIRSTLMCS
jgi:hypothetical protein